MGMYHLKNDCTISISQKVSVEAFPYMMSRTANAS